MENAPASERPAVDRSEMSETQFAMISDWVVNRNVNECVKAHPDAKRLELVGFSVRTSPSFVYDRIAPSVGRCCLGLDLHPSQGIIHGDV